MKAAFLISTLTLLATAPAMAADAPVCLDSNEMEATLIDWYGLSPVNWTRTEDSVVWASDDTGVWALVDYRDDYHEACVIEKGQDWDDQGGQAFLSAQK